MTQSEILSILDHPMTAKEIADRTKLPLQTAKGNLVRMKKNGNVAVCGKKGKQLIYVGSA